MAGDGEEEVRYQGTDALKRWVQLQAGAAGVIHPGGYPTKGQSLQQGSLPATCSLCPVALPLPLLLPPTW